MPVTLTKEQLIEKGRKAAEREEKDRLRTRVNAAAVKRLIAAHKPEYKQLQIEEAQRLGVK